MDRTLLRLDGFLSSRVSYVYAGRACVRGTVLAFGRIRGGSSFEAGVLVIGGGEGKRDGVPMAQELP